MILTITMNPSIDYLYESDTFILNTVNKMKNPKKMIGGKGINAARTASILGGDVIALAAIAGQNGEFLKKQLLEEKFSFESINISGDTRNAITIMHNEQQTEITEEGPIISPYDEKLFYKRLSTILSSQPQISIVCISGSVNSKDENFYNKLIDFIKKFDNKQRKILLDISGTYLKNVVFNSIGVDFIKPNLREFSELFGEKKLKKNELPKYLTKKCFSHIPFILVSCGGEGAVAKYGDLIYDLVIPKITPVNLTGSGDATVGGVAYSLDHNKEIEEILKIAMACGVSNALEEGVGYVTIENVKKFKNQIITTEHSLK